jgi:3-carboxy-cis,cis-muconate cycloisomerase
MTFSAIDSGLTGPLFASDAMRAVFSDRAALAAMLAAETALARAEAADGLVPKGLAAALARIKPEDLDIAALGAHTRDAGVVAIPFVKAVEALLPENLRAHVHKGATSQDIVDTSLVLQMADAFGLIAGDLVAILDGLTALVRKHTRTPCVGRTYGQHAAPVTFGYVAGTWAAGLAEVAADLPALRERVLVASLGGPVGTLAGLGDAAETVGKRFARELGLAAAPLTWHTNRTRMVAAGSWLTMLMAALARMATDVAFLSATEIGEVSEAPAAGRGGSSAMPHKQNPLSSAVILSAHAAAPGFVVTLMNAAVSGQQRPTGLWQAEWHALPSLFGLASGALREARRIAGSLVVHGKRMRANLGITSGLVFADAAASALAGKMGRSKARALVTSAAAKVRETGMPLREALAEAGAPAALLDAAFDLRPATAAAATAAQSAVRQAQAVKRLIRKL